MRDTALRRSKILIIDDDVEVAELLRQILARDGYLQVESTTDPSVAIRRFEEFRPDLVVLDLSMRGVSGLELLAHLREIIPPETHLPILVLTGDSSIETRREALRRGATDFLAKPYDTAEILARIRTLLETRFLHRLLATRQEELEARTLRLTDANSALQAELTAANERLLLEPRKRRRAKTGVRQSGPASAGSTQSSNSSSELSTVPRLRERPAPRGFPAP